MKLIRMLLLGIAVSLSFAGTAQAQGGPGAPGGRQGRMMEMLMKGIELSDTQKAKIDTITVKYQAEMPQMQPGTPRSPEAMTKRREVMQKQQADIRSVLTDEQKKVFDKNLEEMQANMPRRPGQ